MPTTANMSYSNQKLEPVYDPDLARQRAVAIAPGQSVPRGAVLGELTASPGVYSAYNASHSDGTQIAKAICTYDITTDSSGNVTLSATTSQTAGPYGDGFAGQTAPVYVSGVFNTAELVGLDATAIVDLGARFEQGSLTAGGILHIP